MPEPAAPSSDSGPGLASKGLLRQWVTTLGAESLAVFLTAIALLTYLDLHALSARPLDYSDLTLPYLRGGVEVQLSQPEAWYDTLVRFLYLSAPGGSYGPVLNSLEVYSYALGPITMLILLYQFGLPRAARIGGAIFYLANPVVLTQASPGFISWSLFFSLAPLILALFVVYDRTNASRWLVAAAFLLVLLTQLDPLDGVRLIAPLLVGVLILPWITHRKKSLGRIGLDYLVFGAIVGGLLLLQFVPTITSVQYYLTAGSGSSEFYNFHIGNVAFTYRDQNVLNSLSGLALYPGGNPYLYGYGHTAVWLLWIAVVLACLVAAALVCLLAVPHIHRGNQDYYSIFLGTALAVVALQVGIANGTLVWIFRAAPFMFEYEYPTIWNYVQVVLYTVFFGLLVDECIALVEWLRSRAGLLAGQRVDTVISNARRSDLEQPDGRGGKGFGSRWRRGLPTALTLVCVGVLCLGVNFPLVVQGPSNPSNPTTDNANFLPAYYSGVGSFFAAHQGLYRVLPLPLNYTSIIDLESAVPISHIFGIPFGGVNSPGLYPNTSLLQNALDSIAAGHLGSMAASLASDDVGYILVLHPGSDAPVVSAGSSYNPYLNGGGGSFLRGINATSGLVAVANTSDYVVLQNERFAGPVQLPTGVITYGVASAPGHEPPERIHELVASPGFENGSSWASWTSCEGPARAHILFGSRIVTLSTCSGAEATGSTTHTPQTEIYQRVSVFPGEALTLQVNFSTYVAGAPSLIIIFHNASNDDQFYSDEQYFPHTTRESNSTFSYNITAPADAIDADVGIQVFNDSAAPANVSLVGFEVTNAYAFLPPAPYSDLPMAGGGIQAFPASEGLLAVVPYFPSAMELGPSTDLNLSEVGQVIGDSVNGTVYLPAGSWTFAFICPTPAAASAYVDLTLDGATVTVDAGSASVAVSTDGWYSVPATCAAGQPQTVSLNVSGSGYAAVVRLLSLAPAASPGVIVPLVETRSGSASFRYGAPGAGLAVLVSAEVISVGQLAGAQIRGSAQSGGLTVYVVSVSTNGTLVIRLPWFEPVSQLSVLSNVSVLAVTVAGIACVASRRIWHSLVKGFSRLRPVRGGAERTH